MSELNELIQQRAALDAAIRAAKPAAVGAVLNLMTLTGLTLSDLGPMAKAPAVRAVKYRDAEGNTWAGRGKRPNWVRVALADGKSLDDYLA